MNSKKKKKATKKAAADQVNQPKNEECVYLRRVNESGDHSKLTEQSFNDLLKSCNEHCFNEDETLVFPLFPNLHYDGPTGLNAVPEKTDQEKVGNVIGDSNELKVLRTFEEVSRSKNLGLKLFPGIIFDRTKLELLAKSFKNTNQNLDQNKECIEKCVGNNDNKVIKTYNIKTPDEDFLKKHFPIKKKMDNIETDLICIYKGAICLLEVKSNSRPEILWVNRPFNFIF
jgi:hypothetical protein